MRFAEDDFPPSIQAYSAQEQEWIPVFWVREDGSGYMRASGFFQNEVSYERAIEIATHLQAFIYGDAEEIYFLPGYGVLIDKAEMENPEVRIEDLRRYKPEFGNDYKKIIEAVAQENRRIGALNTKIIRTTIPNTRRPETGSRIWIMAITLIIALLIMYLKMK